jgi:adenine-specific DNA glycosylase
MFASFTIIHSNRKTTEYVHTYTHTHTHFHSFIHSVDPEVCQNDSSMWIESQTCKKYADCAKYSELLQYKYYKDFMYSIMDHP